MKTYLTTYLTTILKALLIFFAPVKGIVILVVIAILLDTCFGLWKSKKTGIEILSKKLRHGLVPKLISYCVAVCLVYATDYFMLNDLTHMVVSIDFLSTKLIGLILLSIEVKSIDESFLAVKGYSFLSKIIGLIHKAKDIKKELAE
jgi:peptidoglycan biosynthesis protein MviN/MurJ (putative lipid II flippase)